MTNLLSAEFRRLIKSTVFRLSLLCSAGLSAAVILMRWSDVRMNPETYARLSVEYRNADGLIFVGGMYVVFMLAVFVSIFVGTEYSDGTIRNKLVAGHTRTAIYLSKLVVCGVADVVIHVLYIVVALALGGLMLEGTTMAAGEILAFTLTSVMAVLAATSLLLLFSMSVQSKAVGAVACLLSVIIMFFAALTIHQRLSAPEYYDAYTYKDNLTGEIVEVGREKNLRYLTGTKRKVYQFLYDFIPASQLYQITMNLSDHLGWIAAYDVLLVIASTGVGIIIFQKKNIS